MVTVLAVWLAVMLVVIAVFAAAVVVKLRHERTERRRWQRDAATLYVALVPFAREEAFTLTEDQRSCTVDGFALQNARAALEATNPHLAEK